jgi:hypothetical protein
MWSQPRTEPVRGTVSATVALIVLAGALTAGCSDIYFDRRETIALGADDHIAANSVEQMVDPWPRHVSNKNIAFNGERIQAGVERYRRHEVVQPMPLTTNTYTEQHPPPALSTEHVPNVEPAPATSAAAPVAGAKP